MSSATPTESNESSQRKERAAIAAQACQTCRNRKSKCDEQRPKCGLCTRLNVECQYREPLPTKKDKTMVQILDTLNRLEVKFDNLSMSGSNIRSPDSSYGYNKSAASSSQSGGARLTGPSDDMRMEFPTELQRNYQHVTVPHKVILWPSIYIHLINSGIQATSDLQYVLQEGTPWFIRLEMAKHPHPLESQSGLPCFTINNAMHDTNQPTGVGFMSLTIQNIRERCDAYFNTFNVLFPLLNHDQFMNDIVTPLLRTGYVDGDMNGVLALLVFALGEVAIDGVFGEPISSSDQGPSGVRGGSLSEPPGLAIFNEARRRLGFVATMTTLENVQSLILQGIYYESHARHLDYWRCIVAASMACQVVVTCRSVEWTSQRGDLIKRAYWTCMLSEDFYHLDLDLPRTGIHLLEDDVPLPYFHESVEEPGSGGPLAPERSHFQYHFLALIALRRLIGRINSTIHQSTVNSENSEDYGGPPARVIQELNRQLESWRSLLPRPLQWSDNDRFDFPNQTDASARRPNELLFASDQGSVPIGHKYSLDVVTAQLRTRFYYARFIMYRPFIYKALHFPELMTQDDADYCATAIKAACLWPIALAPPKTKKRVVPHLFAWTQNFMGILLILRMTTENECLRAICESQVFHEDVQRAATAMLDWIRDVKQLDGVAEWCWRILEPLYLHAPGGSTPGAAVAGGA